MEEWEISYDEADLVYLSQNTAQFQVYMVQALDHWFVTTVRQLRKVKGNSLTS